MRGLWHYSAMRVVALVLPLLLAISACGSDRFDGQMIVTLDPSTSGAPEDVIAKCGKLPTVASAERERDPINDGVSVTFDFEDTTHDQQGVVRSCVDKFQPSSILYP